MGRGSLIKSAKRHNLGLLNSDNRPREERPLHELYPTLNTHAPIILMNVPPSYLVKCDSSQSSTLEDEDDECGDEPIDIRQNRYYPQCRIVEEEDGENSDRVKSIKTHKWTQNKPEKKPSPPNFDHGNRYDTALPARSDLIKRINRVKENIKPSICEKVNVLESSEKHVVGPRPPEYIQDMIYRPSDYDVVIEYDLDTYDRAWLKLYNAQRAEKGLGPILDEHLERAINALEKEWYKLIYPVMSQQADYLFPDDTQCSICGSAEASNTDMIIFCDRCDVAVHQECYGIPNVPEGKWLCLPCAWSPNEEIKCALCPHYDGAFKQTETGTWAHTACAHWIEETGFSNETYLEPITGVEDVPKTRWTLKCRLCGLKGVGAPIQCSVKHCGVAYHPNCAKKGCLYMDYFAKKSYCPKHTPKDHLFNLKGIDLRGLLSGSNEKDYIDQDYFQSFMLKSVLVSCGVNNKNKNKPPAGALGSTKTVSSAKSGPYSDRNNNKKKQSDAKRRMLKRVRGRPSAISKAVPRLKISLSSLNHETGLHGSAKAAETKSSIKISQIPPVGPEYIVQKVLHGAMRHVAIDDKEGFVLDVCKYWTLRRERKGAPLIRRLQMEPTLGTTIYDSDQLRDKLNYLKPLRINLETLRLLCELVQRIHVSKLKGAMETRAAFKIWKCPLYCEMKRIITKLKDLDTRLFFAKPVDAALVPDYYAVTKHPMDFFTMEWKLDEQKYFTLDEFISDFKLICSNAMTYNKNTTTYYRSANQLLNSGLELIKNEQSRLHHLNIRNLDDSMSIDSLDTYLLPFPRSFSFDTKSFELKMLGQENCKTVKGSSRDHRISHDQDAIEVD